MTDKGSDMSIKQELIKRGLPAYVICENSDGETYVRYSDLEAHDNADLRIFVSGCEVAHTDKSLFILAVQS